MTFSNGDVARVTAKMSFQGEDQQNVYYVSNIGAGAISDAAAVTEIAARVDFMHAALVPQQHEDLDYDSIEVFNITTDAPMGEVPWPTLTNGDINLQDPLPSQVCGLVLFPTNVARSQGRKFIGGLIEGDSSNGVPDNDIITAMGTYATRLLTAWLVGTGAFKFGNYNSTLARFAEWTSSLVRDVFRTQRRRAKLTGS